jgi:OFA family oxalate/formate antiporter-like MFS transporter
MLCLGGVYSWSIFSAELIENHNWSSIQTQLVFGLILSVFPITMLFAGKLEKRLKPGILTLMAAITFSLGYIIAGLANGNFWLTLLGLGLFAGIGTGFGYSVAMSVPVKWFPEKKGLITGIAAAGFGLASVLLSKTTEWLFLAGTDMFKVFIIVGIVYGLLIMVSAMIVKSPQVSYHEEEVNIKAFLKNRLFYRLFAGIFFGTFAGLLVIGNLSTIGAGSLIKDHVLILGVSLFAVANFFGRLTWGFLSDHLGGNITIFLALLFQSAAIFLMGRVDLTPNSFLIISSMIGFCFGSNFVLFAKETSHYFGVGNFAVAYPYIFLGYAIAGIFGPLIGGFLYDIFGSYDLGIIIASLMSLAGASLFMAGFINDLIHKKSR